MDTPEEAAAYDAMDHRQVNQTFVADLLVFWPAQGSVLDVGTGTAQIPIELCRHASDVQVVGTDLAESMLAIGRDNVRRAGFERRIELRRHDAKEASLPANFFQAVISNSIVHHIPEPMSALAEMIRVARSGGAIFVRDLLRPATVSAVNQLVAVHSGEATAHQRQLFEASLRAALTLAEARALALELGFDPRQVDQTSDRHWTWACRKP